MATALYPLRLVQLGFESTQGTLVAATQQMVGEGVYRPEIDREFETFPRGVRAPVTGGGFAIRRGATLTFTTNLDYQQAIFIFGASILHDAAPTGTGPYTWTYTPDLTHNLSTDIRAVTVEYVISDGTTLHYQRESGFGMITSWEITLAFNQPAKITFEMFMRAEQTSTVTGALTPMTGRAQIPSNLFTVFMDPSGGTLGSTQKTTTIREATLAFTSGLVASYTLDGRADLDFTHVNAGMMDATLDLTMEHNATTATEIGIWRGTLGVGGVRLIRLKADNGAATTANRQIQVDLAAKYLEPPGFEHEDPGIEIVKMRMGMEYDSGAALALAAQIINGTSALP